jgi:hypothetical protein
LAVKGYCTPVLARNARPASPLAYLASEWSGHSFTRGVAPRKNKALLCAAAVASAVLVALPAAASAAPASPADPVYTAENATGGVYWRYLSYWGDSQNISGWGFYQGDQIELDCYIYPAGAVEPYRNQLW